MSKKVSYHTLHFICSLTSTLRPKEKMTISEWADANMVLPASSNESGRFRVDNMPHQKDIMDAITDPRTENVSVMSSAQIGKTTILLCGIGYYIEHEPAPQLVVMPTLTLGEKFSKSRLNTMIQDVAVLREKMGPAKSRDANNTIYYKQYAGGYIIVAGANSPASLSSMPCRIVWMDETDRFPESAGEEGNPIQLARKRTTSFWNRKIIQTSTPTITGESKIEEAYNNGSMEEWCVECPCCKTWQPFEFNRVKFENVTMVCINCEEEIPEKDWKQAKQKWIAEHPERVKHRSFHINELASPWVTWQSIIDEFLRAQKRLEKYHDPEDLKVFINTVLGQTWDDRRQSEERTSESALEARAEQYEADMPDGVLMLTAAVDVQDNRFEVEVRGWARDYETWGIYKTEIFGNMEKMEVWEELEDFLKTEYYFRSGKKLGITAAGIDTGGHHTNRTYKWIKAQKQKGKKVFGLKGYAQKPEIPLIYKKTRVDIRERNARGKDIVVDSTDIQIIGTDSGKEDIMNRLTITEPGEGYCHFPSNEGRGYGHEYYKGLLSEVKVTKKVRGILKTSWKKIRERNEPLDLFVYNYAVCELVRPIWGVLEAKIAAGIDYTQKTGKKKKVRRTQQGMDL